MGMSILTYFFIDNTPVRSFFPPLVRRLKKRSGRPAGREDMRSPPAASWDGIARLVSPDSNTGHAAGSVSKSQGQYGMYFMCEVQECQYEIITAKQLLFRASAPFGGGRLKLFEPRRGDAPHGKYYKLHSNFII